MFRFPRLALPLLAVTVLAACTHGIRVPLPDFDSPPPPSREAAILRLDAATPCCHVWADLPFHQALPVEPREFTIDKFSPVADIDGERTHFLTFVLPKFTRAYRVVFQTRPSARHLGNSFLLAPTVTLLNADYVPLSSADVPLCVYMNWRPSMSGAFGAVTVSNPNAQFLVVTTSKAQLVATTYWALSPTSFNNVDTHSASAFASVKAATPATSGSFDVAHGPEGTLYVGRITPAYESAVDNGMCGKTGTGSGLLPELHNSFQNR